MKGLPDGWQVEKDPCYGTILHWPGKGCVTINFHQRSFLLGCCYPTEYGHKAYNGRGWKDRLTADAVAALKEALGMEGE